MHKEDTDVQAEVHSYVGRVRLLLSPLFAPPESSSSLSIGTKVAGNHTRVKANGGPPAFDQEPHVPLQLVKPSARFGSLWVGTAKSQ